MPKAVTGLFLSYYFAWLLLLGSILAHGVGRADAGSAWLSVVNLLLGGLAFFWLCLVLACVALVWALIEPWRARGRGGQDKPRRCPDTAAVVTLVHGTWGQRSKWPDKESPLYQTVQRALPESTEIYRFKWTGFNSVTARDHASAQLRAYLYELRLAHPKAKHYVVGHSHGASIALSALRDPTLSEWIDGVICLSTPFLHARAREFRSREFTQQVLFLTISSMLMFVAEILFWWCCMSLLELWAGISLAALIAVGALMIGLLLLVTRWRAWGDHVIDALKFPAFEPARVLIVRMAGDEAAEGLLATRVLSWLFSSCLAGVVDRVRVWSDIARRHAWGGISVTVAFVSLIIRYTPAFEPGRPALTGLAILLALAALMLLWEWLEPGLFESAVTTGALMLIPLPFAVFLPYGPEFVVTGPLVDVSVEPAPPGRWTVYQVQEVGTGLAHTAIYQNPTVLQLIGNWVAERAYRGAKPTGLDLGI